MGNGNYDHGKRLSDTQRMHAILTEMNGHAIEGRYSEIRKLHKETYVPNYDEIATRDVSLAADLQHVRARIDRNVSHKCPDIRKSKAKVVEGLLSRLLEGIGVGHVSAQA